MFGGGKGILLVLSLQSCYRRLLVRNQLLTADVRHYSKEWKKWQQSEERALFLRRNERRSVK